MARTGFHRALLRWRDAVRGAAGCRPARAAGACVARVWRVAALVIRKFRHDDCPLHASALTLNTLMAIVPVLALSLFVARGFGAAERAERLVKDAVHAWLERFSEPFVPVSAAAPGAGPASACPPSESAPPAAEGAQTHQALSPPAAAAAGPAPRAPGSGDAGVVPVAEQVNRLVEKVFEYVDKVNFAALGGVGIVLLLWTMISVLGQVEASFNCVWEASAGRSLWRKFADYVSVMMVFPILIVAATSIPAADFVLPVLDKSAARAVREALGSAALQNAAAWVLTTAAFTFLIMFMPNTRVRFRSGLVGGVVAASLFLLWLVVCAKLQGGVSRWGKVYGSFAVVPIVLAWVYVSWEIVLLGAEAAFAAQNREALLKQLHVEDLGFAARVGIALSVLRDAARSMESAAPGLDLEAYAARREYPVGALQQVGELLVDAGVAGRVAGRENTLVMLRAPATVSVKEVVDLVTRAGAPQFERCVREAAPDIDGVLARIEGGVARAVEGMSIADLCAGREEKA